MSVEPRNASNQAEALASIAEVFKEYRTFLVAAHVGPDGDAIGSGLAMKAALEALGKEVALVSSDGVPVSCRFLPNWQSVVSSPTRQPECAVLLDCDGTAPRVAAPYHYIQNARCRVLIDHHRSSQPLFEVNWIDPHKSATALMLFHLLRHLKSPITSDTAQCLLAGLSTDTGNFRFPNTTPDSLRAASELVEAGADPAVVAFKLFDERSFESTRLLGLALQKMQRECDGELVWTALTTTDFQQANTGDEGSENVVNYLRNVRGARMAVILRERVDETGMVARISVRSEPELRADLFCKQFGGGGHAAAAGCRLRYQPFADSIQTILKSATVWLREEHPPLSSHQGE